MGRKVEVKILGDERDLVRAFRSSDRAAGSFGSRLGASSRVVARNLAIAGAAIGGLGVVASKGFASYEQTMDRVVGLAGGVRTQVGKFSQEILRIAPDLGKGPRELGEALYFTASAGIAVNKQMEVVRRSAKGSAAGLGETQVVADAVTSAMNAYGPSLINAAKATDVLAATVREGKGEAAAFAPVIGTVASLAAELGVKFHEVGAALAAQTRLGVGAEVAAVQLQATFSSLLKTTPKTAKALKTVGLSHAGLRRELKEKGLLSLLSTLRERFRGNTAALAESFPNIRALRGLLNLVGKNAEQVRGVFERMQKSVGALDIAFGAVAEGEAFKFKQTMSALAVVGIRLGAIFAPVAKRIADGATAALKVVDRFLQKLGEAKTIRGKIDVVWQGVQDAAAGAQNILSEAISRIDWDKVWSSAGGIADGLQTRLEETNWEFIGQRIGSEIRRAIGVVLPAAKQLAERLSNAVAAVDFTGLGKKLGPELAAAVVTGFLTLMDPTFWIKNWDLALGIALVALGGPIGKLAGKLGVMLVKATGTAVLATAGALGRLGPLFVDAMLLAGRLAARALGAVGGLLLKAVRGIFARIGRLATFVVKVLGIQAVINAIVGFAKNVGGVFSRLGDRVREILADMWEGVKRRAIKAALEIIEPFTHLPGFLGGGPFQRLKEQWSQTLGRMESDTVVSTAAIQNSINGLQDKIVTVTIVTKGGLGDERDTGARPQSGIGDAVTRAAAAGAERVAKDAVQIGKQIADTEAKAANAIKQQRQVAARAAKQAARQAAKALQDSKDAFAKLMDVLGLAFDRVAVTKSLQDDLRVAGQMVNAVQSQIKVEGRTTDLLRQLFDAQQRRNDVARQIADAQIARRKGRQFTALGLTETGDIPVPGVGALRKRLGNLRQLVDGTFLDTPKTGSQLDKIALVLRGKFGKVGKDVRQAILQMFNDITGALNSGDKQKGPLTKFRVANFSDIAGQFPTLSAQERKNLQQLLSRRGAGGTIPQQSATGGAFGFDPGGRPSGGGGTLHVHVNIDGREVGDVVIREVERKRGRSSGSRTGPGARREGGV